LGHLLVVGEYRHVKIFLFAVSVCIP